MKDTKRYPFSWQMGWSYSRANTFRACQRQYWYQYYAKRMYNNSSPPRLMDEDVGNLHEAMALKQLTHLYFIVGHAVHDTIAKILREFQAGNELASIKAAKKIAIDKFNFRLENEILFEKAYDISVSQMDILERKKDVIKSIETFYSTRWIPVLLATTIEERTMWKIDPPGYGEFRFKGEKIYAKPDFLFKYEDDVHILDWKTGKPHREDNKNQIQAYMFFAIDVYGYNQDSLIGVVEYLTYPEEEPEIVIGSDIDPELLWNLIRKDLTDMEALLSKVEDNWPKPVSEFKKNPTEFNCDFCNYRRLCNPTSK